jgi:hypothetical protein
MLLSKRSRKILIVLVLLVPVLLCCLQCVSAEERLFEGRPAFKEGTNRCYFVWREGRDWHVRWTTRGNLLRFSGQVRAEEGELQSLKRIDVEVERRVIRPGGPVVARGPWGRPRVVAGRPPVVATREQDHIQKDGDRRIVFLARTDDDIDGFDFKVDKKVRTLHFILEIEGKTRTEEVEVGRSNVHPLHNPFLVKVN